MKNLFFTLLKPFYFFVNLFDGLYLNQEIKQPIHVGHSKWLDYLVELGNKEGMRILEVGSREVTGISYARTKFDKAEYIGFDYYPGSNVDVVGDVHQLSSYFKPEDKFDIIFTSACFEHFAMPWIASVEIAKMLKVGGIVMVETHFSFGAHELPWNFFQFSDEGLRALFPERLGIECLDLGMSNPMVGRFSSKADAYLQNRPIRGLYCHSEFLGKKIKEVENFDWNHLILTDVVGDTEYPKPRS